MNFDPFQKSSYPPKFSPSYSCQKAIWRGYTNVKHSQKYALTAEVRIQLVAFYLAVRAFFTP